MTRTASFRALPIRLAIVAPAIVSAFMATGCGAEAVVASYFAEYVSFNVRGVDTDVIFPRVQGASRFLTKNWPTRSIEGDSMWVIGYSAQIEFSAGAAGAPRFVAEAEPFTPPGAPVQVLRLRLNESLFASTEMRAGWHTYEFELPPQLLRVGGNKLELLFEHALKPADFYPDNSDPRPLAARFRRLELRRESARPHWPERPEEVALVTPTDTPSEPVSPALVAYDERDLAVIAMPADSFFDVYAGPTEDTEILGEMEIEFADPGADGRIRAVIDVIEPGSSTSVWEAEFTASSEPTRNIRAALAPWAGKMIGVRVRVFGDANGVVRWKGLGTTTTLEGGAVPASPSDIVIPARSAILNRPDIFVILLDAARADAFDGSRDVDLTPNVTELAGAGTRFTNVWAPSSWTGQSVPSLLAGMAPDALGIESWVSRQQPTVITVPEFLAEADYHAVLWSQHTIYEDNPPLRHGFEDTRIFGAYQDAATREMLPPATFLLDDERPTFALIHLWPPHAPYEPPAPFAGSRSAWYSGDLDPTDVTLDGVEQLIPEAQKDVLRRLAVARYEENVQYADHLVGRLVELLKQSGRYDSAMIVILSDHGEAFYEHGMFLHASKAFEEFLRVPLVVKWPSGPTAFESVVDTPVSLLDVAPTIIDALGIEDDRARFQGHSLLPLARGQAVRERLIYAYTVGDIRPTQPATPWHTIRWGDLKIVSDPFGSTALYRLSDDPGETVDVSSLNPFETGFLVQSLKLTRWRNKLILLGAGGRQDDELDPEMIESLRALGYLR